MGWKSWPYWKRGGITGAVVSLILIILYYINFELYCQAGECSLGAIFWIFAYFPSSMALLLFSIPALSQTSFLAYPLVFILGTFQYFLIGALIGWIVGKIKEIMAPM